jgi:hypothetical protein
LSFYQKLCKFLIEFLLILQKVFRVNTDSMRLFGVILFLRNHVR